MSRCKRVGAALEQTYLRSALERRNQNCVRAWATEPLSRHLVAGPQKRCQEEESGAPQARFPLAALARSTGLAAGRRDATCHASSRCKLACSTPRARLPRKCPRVPRGKKKKKKPPTVRKKGQFHVDRIGNMPPSRSDWCQRGLSTAAPEIEQPFSGSCVPLRTGRLSG